MNALGHIVTAVGASWSRSQERMPCARVLWDRLHSTRSNTTPQTDDGLVRPERPALQGFRLFGYLEQPVRMGGVSRFHMA